MSSKAINTATTHFLRFRLQYSSLALLYYDYVLTFPREVQYIWRQKFRLSTLLYIGCRYALVANVLYLLAIANKLGQSVVSGALSVVGRLAIIIVFTLRSSAVFGKNKWVFAYMSLVGLACFALDITHVPGLQCSGTAAIPMLSILTIIFETSSTFFTAIRCRQALRVMNSAERRKYSVVSILLQQGVLFFCSISIFTVAGVILQYPGFFQRLPNAFTLPLSCMLTARFILHLRKWYATQLDSTHIDVNSKSATFAFQVSDATTTTNGELTTMFPALAMAMVDEFGPDPTVVDCLLTTENAAEMLVRRNYMSDQDAYGGDVRGAGQERDEEEEEGRVDVKSSVSPSMRETEIV
ncbi:hypothetical protein FB45DRAFT_920115 [Roridomyces roridus]|uniref:DUF6533 domain-containing protein n=1 Tax=Roridomyces roridus TaxID=1738132 RepID=A0AAD7BPK9_9AGAR|nr:hypothetical protein FB45DRAFT_920115 [Roridomyces roridus]